MYNKKFIKGNLLDMPFIDVITTLPFMQNDLQSLLENIKQIKNLDKQAEMMVKHNALLADIETVKSFIFAINTICVRYLKFPSVPILDITPELFMSKLSRAFIISIMQEVKNRAVTCSKLLNTMVGVSKSNISEYGKEAMSLTALQNTLNYILTV